MLDASRHDFLLYMPEQVDKSLKQWYVLSARGSVKHLEQQFSALSASRLRNGEEAVEYFMPTCVVASSLFGESTMTRKKLVGNYIFVHDSYNAILDMKRSMDSLWLLPHPDSNQDGKRYMTISDHDMAVFKAIAVAYANELPCYPIGMVDLEEGDKVEIVGGEFDGVCGTLQCRQGHNGGKVLMAVGNLFLVSTPDIRPQYIRILQFGKGNRHPYRKFEAHLSRAILALNHLFDRNASGLTTEDVAAMAVFVGRFEALKPATVNIASQHATLMLMSYTALQDKEKAAHWLHCCRTLLPKVKSDTQRAWQLVFMYVSTGNAQFSKQAQSIIAGWNIASSDRKRTLIVSTLNDFTRLYTTTGLIQY